MVETQCPTFLVHVGDALDLRLTAKKPHKPFGSAIVDKALSYYNEKRGASETVVRCRLQGAEPDDLSIPIQSVVATSPANGDGVHEVWLTLFSQAKAEAEGRAKEEQEAVEVQRKALRRAALPKLQADLKALLQQTLPEDIEAALKAIASPWTERGGWTPEAELARQDLLWHIDADELLGLRAASESEVLKADYAGRRADFEPFESSMPSAPKKYKTNGRTVPRVRLGDGSSKHPPDVPPALPHDATRYFRAGMSCVLSGAQLWPRAEALWGRRGYLAAELGDSTVRVLKADYREAARCATFVRRRPVRLAFHRTAQPFALGPDEVANDASYYPYTAPAAEEVEMDGSEFFGQRHTAAEVGHALLLETDLLEPNPDQEAAQEEGGSKLIAAHGLGSSSLLSDIRGIHAGRMQQLRSAAGLGAPKRARLTCATRATGCTFTLLRHEPCDALHLQLVGKRTFLLFPPTRANHLRGYPCHHPLDRSSQLAATASRVEEWGCEVVVEAGDLLFVPAWWWYVEIIDVEADASDPDEPLVAGVSFVFDATHRYTELTRLPIQPSLRFELARQLEVVVADCLGSMGHIETFFAALRGEMQISGFSLLPQPNADGATEMLSPPVNEWRANFGEAPWVPPPLTEEELAAQEEARKKAEEEQAALEEQAARAAEAAAAAPPWMVFESMRPRDVDEREWEGLFEYVVLKSSLLLGPQNVLPFVKEMCDERRWKGRRPNNGMLSLN